jgi:hypothetical protein
MWKRRAAPCDLEARRAHEQRVEPCVRVDADGTFRT